MTITVIKPTGHRYSLEVENSGDIEDVISNWLHENFTHEEALAALEAVEPLAGRVVPPGKVLLSHKNTGWQAILSFRKNHG